MKEVQPMLSMGERDCRWGLVKELIRDKGLDCLIMAGLNGREQFESYLKIGTSFQNLPDFRFASVCHKNGC